ncbi:ribonuclease P protein subunit p29 [Agrilus planipennis]|uniref:Ribonuclease P protein subunit p29 n=1 Tax=Agrilus planipennis TaxID=224129 RepID=A0A1W4X2R9_AGRPL|nr:ribonuclease P protein subunit p29 [Agrilus planipennis]
MMVKTPMKVSEILITPLPSSSSPNPNRDPKAAQEIVTTYLNNVLPTQDKKNLGSDIKWYFMLDKTTHKKNKPIRKKKSYLTRKERKELNLLRLPKEDWDYKQLEPLRNLWKQYIKEVLGYNEKLPNYTDPHWTIFSSSLMKSEFVGAEIKVIRSNVPSLVDLSGTIVLETKATFQIVTPSNKLKIILKAPCIFEISLDVGRISFMGNSLITKPSERSAKKIKNSTLPDL